MQCEDNVCSVASCVPFFGTPWTVVHQALCPWDSPGKNTGVGCHTLLQVLNLYLVASWFFTASEMRCLQILINPSCFLHSVFDKYIDLNIETLCL